jgi:cytochrome P450
MSVTAEISVEDFNPLKPEFFANPYPYYKLLRQHRALYVEALDSWWVGRLEDVRTMSNDVVNFSHAKFQEFGLGEFDFAPNVDQLVATDPPVHTRLRKLANQGFTPKRLKLLDGDIQERIAKLIDGAKSLPGRRFDFMHDFADLLPVSVVADLIGADPQRCPDYRYWTRSIMSASNRKTMTPEQHAEIRKSVADARAYFGSLIAHYKQNPAENIICDFITAQDNDDRLSDEEILALVILLMIGGDETTGHLMGNLLTQLTMNPDQYEILRADPSRIGDAIDESLRHWAPVQTAFMWTTNTVQIGDVSIPPDSTVVAVWGSANHDPDHYANPEKFDITRKKQGHMSFGSGPHFCVGNMLARQEATKAFRMFLEEMPHLRVEAPEDIEWFPSFWMRGPKSLPVVY